MDTVSCEHKELASGRWSEMSFASQVGNLGSEVSRSLKWFGKNEKRFQVSFNRTLELFDLTMEAARRSEEAGAKNEPSRSAKLKEICRAREEFCDYFTNGNSWGTNPQRMLRYYDQFAILSQAQ